MSISERDKTILNFMFKQDRGLLTERDWEQMDEIQKDNEDWDKYKELFKGERE